MPQSPDSSVIPRLSWKWTARRKMLIVSSAFGPKHIALLRMMAPTVAYYALKHGMDYKLIPLKERLAPDRPPAWDKIMIIRHALRSYETVMWIDSDAIICDPSKDIQKALDPNYPIHLVAHRIGRRTIPNTGVWIMKNTPQVIALLDALWSHTRYIEHRWWEQAGFMDLIGYDMEAVRFRKPTPYTSLVKYLGNEWNSRDKDQAKSPVIYHFCNKEKSTKLMKEKYEQFLHHILMTEGGLP